MAFHLFGTEPLPKLILTYYILDSWEQISVKFESKNNNLGLKIYSEYIICKMPACHFALRSFSLTQINFISSMDKLDMSTACRRLKSPQSQSGTSAHPTMVTLVNIMVMNRWLTSFSFHVNQPSHSWDKAISDSDLEISTPRSRSWVWWKGKAIQSAQYHINSLHFHFTSIRPTIPETELFRNLTLKHPRSRSWVRSTVKVTYCTQYPTDALPFRFTSIGPTIPEIRPK